MPLNIEKMAANLRGYRAKARMTQDEVAATVGVSRITLSNYENGTTVPQVDTAWALADLYEVTIDELMGYERREE